MDAIVEKSNGQIQPILEAWDTVDTTTVLRFGSDRYDPSFFISYDVYFHGVVPDPEVREKEFAFAGAFEATVDGLKDRFLIDNVPIRIEYKAISEIDVQISRARNPEMGEFSGTTYGLFRLVNAEILFNRSNWLPVVRRLLDDLPQEFWVRRIFTLRAHMEHALSDLTSAAYAEEDLFFQLSLARFLETSCGLIVALNRRFDPPGRILRSEVESLPLLPEEFSSRFEHLLRSGDGTTGTRKRQIAELLARSLLRLS